MIKTLVIKIGGRLQGEPELVAAVATFRSNHQQNICVVHGGGDQVTELQRKLGIEPAFIAGRRITKPEDMDLFRMVLSGSVNKELVSQFCHEGLAAIGISGEDGPLLQAVLFDEARLGVVGRVTKVDTKILQAYFNLGVVPIISPVSRDQQAGVPLNVNADDAAFAIAEALGADELLLLTDVDGVAGPDGTIPELGSQSIEQLIMEGHIKDGMVPKIRAAQDGVGAGIGHVRIAGINYLLGREQGTLIGE